MYKLSFLEPGKPDYITLSSHEMEIIVKQQLVARRNIHLGCILTKYMAYVNDLSPQEMAKKLYGIKDVPHLIMKKLRGRI